MIRTTKLPNRRSPTDTYSSAFAKWDERSWVRSKEHHLAPFEPDLEFFSAAVAPLFLHARVREADASVRRSLLVLHLYDWLEFTEWLELGPVNRACDLLRRESFLPWLPAEMRADALKIYTDEAGHAEMSHALGDSVVRATGVTPLRLRPAFLTALDEMVAAEDPEHEPLLTVLFATVSETLITGSLKRLPNDPTVQKAVRDLAKDHAIDEGLHHAFFRSVFVRLWPRLSADLRRRLGPLLPRMILAFLEPDVVAMRGMLERFPDAFDDPAGIAREVADSDEMRAVIEEAAVPAMRVLAHGGAFEEPAVAAAFKACGLLPPAVVAEA
jgi:hypothetical protein